MPLPGAAMRPAIPLATTLRRRWPGLARAGCAAVALLTAGLWAVSIAPHYQQHLARSGPNMDNPDILRANLAGLGLSVGFYARYTLALELLFTLVFFAVAVVLFQRRSAGGMALVVALFLVTFGATFPGTLQGLAASHPAWYAAAGYLEACGWGLFALCLYLFPDGRFVPRWTRWPAVVFLVGYVLPLLFPGSPADANTWPPPLFFLQLLGLAGTGIFAQVYRYRRVSDPTQRQQTKWVVLGLAAPLAGIVGFALPSLLVPSLDQQGSLYDLGSTTTIIGCFLLIPLALALAVLRYRLWAIDLLIARALVYGALTVAVVALYVLVVGALGALFRTSGNLLVALLATGVVAVLFQPLRARLQRAANRLLYGERDEPYAVISRLGRRLEGTLAPAAILPTIVETVAGALRLPYAAIALGQGAGRAVVAATGTPAPDPLCLPLTYQGEAVGELLLAPRAPGEGFTAADRRLLADLARQAGVAARAVRLADEARHLAADLQVSRERLVLAREEERRRLRRDLHDGLGPRLAALTLRVETARDRLAHDPLADELLGDLAARLEEAVADVRRVVYALRPPALDDLGLLGARRQAAEGYGPGATRIAVEAPPALPTLPAAVEVAAYHIAQEALTNVVRHAGARACTLHLAHDSAADSLAIEVADDGRGIAPGRAAGVGLASLRERAAELGGSCDIGPRPGGGTLVRAVLPCRPLGAAPEGPA